MHLRLHRRFFLKASLACSADLSQVPSLWNAGISSPVIFYVPSSQFSLMLEHSVLLAPRIRARPWREDLSFGGMLPRKFLYQLLPGQGCKGGKRERIKQLPAVLLGSACGPQTIKSLHLPSAAQNPWQNSCGVPGKTLSSLFVGRQRH